MAGIQIDDARWPLVVVTWPTQPLTNEDVERFLAESLVLVRRGRHAVLHIGIRASGLDSRQRRRIAAHIQNHNAALARSIAATALVVKSAVLYGMVTAINWLSPPSFPQRVFREREEAEAWLAEAVKG